MILQNQDIITAATGTSAQNVVETGDGCVLMMTQLIVPLPPAIVMTKTIMTANITADTAEGNRQNETH